MTKRHLTQDAEGRWQCVGCLLWKPAWEFSRNRAMFNGLSAYCKTCSAYDQRLRDRNKKVRVQDLKDEIAALEAKVEELQVLNTQLREQVRRLLRGGEHAETQAHVPGEDHTRNESDIVPFVT